MRKTLQIMLCTALGAAQVSAAPQGDTTADLVDLQEDRCFYSTKGHQVKFWRDGKDQWRADVAEDFTGIEHEGLPVGFGDDWSVEKLIGETSSKNRLHVLLRKELPEDFQEDGLVYVGSLGLKGGCEDCEDNTCIMGEKCIQERDKAHNEWYMEANQQINEEIKESLKNCEEAIDDHEINLSRSTKKSGIGKSSASPTIYCTAVLGFCGLCFDYATGKRGICTTIGLASGFVIGKVMEKNMTSFTKKNDD